MKITIFTLMSVGLFNMLGAFSTRYEWLGNELFSYRDIDAFLAGEFGRIPAVDLLKRSCGKDGRHTDMLDGATIQGGVPFEDLPFQKVIAAIASEFLGTERPLVKLFISASAAAWGLHQDPQDMVVLQLLGSKLWRLGFPMSARSTETTSIVISPELLKASRQSLHEHYLNSGQMLYLPRDTAHWVSFETGQSDSAPVPSVHLTLTRQHHDLPPPGEEMMVIFHR